MTLYSVPFGLIMEWMCLITSILTLRKASPKFWQTFIPYLAITVGVETYAYISIKFFGNTNTHLLYNVFLLVYMCFHLYIFSKIIELKHIKKIILIFFLILIGFYISGWLSNPNSFFSISNTVFGGVIILLSIIYYLSIFKLDELKQAEFWLVTGCLIFYSFTSCTNAFFDQLITIEKKEGIPIRYIMFTLGNIVMYGCWIKSFLCLKDKKIYFQQ